MVNNLDKDNQGKWNKNKQIEIKLDLIKLKETELKLVWVKLGEDK